MHHVGQVRICQLPDWPLAPEAICKWPDGRVTWGMRNHPVPGRAADVRAIYEAAWASWAKVANITPIFSDRPSEARVVMDAGTIDGPRNILAWSEMPCGAARQVEQRYDSAENWDLGEGGDILLLAVAAHEIGHALGIPHIATGNLMQPYYSPEIRAPQAGDIAEAVGRYGRPGQPVPPPPPPAPAPGPGYLPVACAGARFAEALFCQPGRERSPLLCAALRTFLAMFCGGSSSPGCNPK